MPNAWLVRAGEGGRLFDEFAKGYVGVGYYEMGDMSNITSQEDMRTLFLKSYSDINPRAIGNQVAMIYKFRSVFAIGDKVVTYDTKNRKYWIGTIKSDYQYQPGVVGDYPNIRKVIWDGQVDRDDMTISSRNSLGCATTLFSVDEFVWQEFDSVLSGKKPAKEGDSGSAEETDLEQIRKELAEKAHEFIKDKILTLDADDMEELVAAILRGMGYQSRVSPKGPDRGVDVMASPDGLGLEEPRIKAEVKHRQAAMVAAQKEVFLVDFEKETMLYT